MNFKFLCRICFIAIVCLTLFTGCTKESYIDSYSENKDFFNYSLGNHSIVSKKQYALSAPGSKAGTDWVLSYTNDAGEEREFFYNNFSFSLSYYVRKAAHSEIRQMCLNILQEHLVQDTFEISIGIETLEFDYAEDNPDLIDLENGLRLRSFTPVYYHAFEPYNVYIYISVKDDWSRDNWDALSEQIEVPVRAISDNLSNQPEITVELESVNLNKYIVYYDSKTSVFEWNFQEDLFDEENTIDGHLLYVRRVYMQDELSFNSRGFASWNEELSEYCFTDWKYLIFAVLQAKDLVEQKDLNPGTGGPNVGITYEWDMNGVRYILTGFDHEMSRGLYRENEQVLDANASQMDMSLFEEVTGTHVHYDEDKRGIYIEW